MFCKFVKVGKKKRSFFFAQSVEISDKRFIRIIFLAKVVEIGLVQFKGHIRFVCRNFYIILIADAIPKLSISFKNLRNFVIDTVYLVIKLVGVIVCHACIDVVNLLFEFFKTVKVVDKSCFFLLGQRTHILNKALH